MLAETLGVSIETNRAVVDGDFVVDREHDADMAWTSAPITPHTADETLAQLAKTPALPGPHAAARRARRPRPSRCRR